MIRLILLRLLESYYRHRWLYLSPIAFMALAMVGYLVIVPAPYVAQGTLYVQKETLLSTLTSVRTNVFGRYVTPAEETVGELYQLMNSDGFMRAIVQQTELEPLMNEGPKAVEQTLDKVRDSIWFRSLGNNLVEVNTEAESPQVAAQLATSTIETYTRWKTNISRDEGVAAQQFFQGLVTTYRDALDTERQRLTDYLVAHPEPVRGDRPPVEAAEISKLEAAVDLAKERLRDAEDKEEETQLALAQTESNMRQSYFVVDAPTIPLEPTRSKTELALVLVVFLMVGGVFSVAGVVGGAVLDRSFRFPIDVKHGLNLPVLATIPEAEAASLQGTAAFSTRNADSYSQPSRALFPLSTTAAAPTGAAAANGNGSNGANGATKRTREGAESNIEGNHYSTSQHSDPQQNGTQINGVHNGRPNEQQSTNLNSSDEQAAATGQAGSRLKQLFGQK
ncbi:MAG: hypothetical protein KDE19_02380 [Caldilineaceae bacterium]|nr:hypothetical protein [Caldilineaceae bacterium]